MAGLPQDGGRLAGPQVPSGPTPFPHAGYTIQYEQQCFSFVRSFITLPTANPRTVFSSGSDSEDSEAAEALALITEVI